MLAGRQGVIGDVSQALLGHKLVFAYSMSGLFLGYLYFSIPKIVLSVMATAQSMDKSLAEAAHSLGAGSWAVMRDVTLPALAPALIARSEEHTSELQSLMRISYAVFCLKKKKH